MAGGAATRTEREGEHAAIPYKGGKYRGGWESSLRHGHGLMVYSDNRRYEAGLSKISQTDR